LSPGQLPGPDAGNHLVEGGVVSFHNTHISTYNKSFEKFWRARRLQGPGRAHVA
jgi:hypothetical protein